METPFKLRPYQKSAVGAVVSRYTQSGPSTLLLGMTATPRRSDGKSALDVFGSTAFEISRTDLEDLGYLVRMQYFTVRSNLKLDRVKLSGGDFQVGALSKVMDAAATRALTVKAWLEHYVFFMICAECIMEPYIRQWVQFHGDAAVCKHCREQRKSVVTIDALAEYIRGRLNIEYTDAAVWGLDPSDGDTTDELLRMEGWNIPVPNVVA